MNPPLVWPPPVYAFTLATAGIVRTMMFTNWRTELSIGGKRSSPVDPARRRYESRPVSCWGKKPFGILITSTTLRAIGEKQDDEHQCGVVQRPRAVNGDRSRACQLKNRFRWRGTERAMLFVLVFRLEQVGAHHRGVVVSEMTIETRIAVDRVTANSRNKPPDNAAHQQDRE